MEITKEMRQVWSRKGGLARAAQFTSESQRHARSQRLSEKVWRLVVERIRNSQSDVTIHEGAPSFPRDLMLIPGHIEGVAYDPDLQDYVVKDEV